MINWGHPLTVGLENCFLFNEAAGNAVTDLVHGVPCKFAGAVSPTWDPKGLHFGDGADSYVDISKTRRVTTYGARFTIEYIFYYETSTTHRAYFSWDASTSWKCTFCNNTYTPVWYTRLTTSTTSSFAETGTTLGWNHLFLIWDGAIKTTYTNGQLVTSAAPMHGAGIINLADCNNIRIGRAGDYQAIPSYASLFRVWSKVLSREEIQRLYADPYDMFTKRSAWMDYVEPPVGEGVTLSNPFSRPFRQAFGRGGL